MATPDLSAVLNLGKKASELERAGHMARAIEYRKRELAAAQALGAHDSLIVASAQLDLGALETHAAARYCSQHDDESPSQEWFASAKALYVAAIDTLLRRKDAGTLKYGTCRAAEEAWFQQKFMYAAGSSSQRNNELAAARAAPIVGYETLTRAAIQIFMMLRLVEEGAMSLTQEQIQSCLTLLTDVVEYFSRPRADAYVSSTEALFAEQMRDLAASPGVVLSRGGAVGRRLLERWRHVERTGELQRRDIDSTSDGERLRAEALAAAIEAAAAAPGLRCCALASCGAREQHPSHFKSCGACKKVAYCCREHQVEHWPSHKAACKAARKAAPAGKG